MPKNKNRQMELTELETMLIYICGTLNRPIRKSQLIKMVTELFECSTARQVNFALLGLVEQGKLCQKKHFIITPDFISEWNGTIFHESVIKFILSLKEEAKHDLFFDVYASEPLTPHIFFKYIKMKYPALLRRQDTALAYMEQLNNTFPYGLNNSFYAEMNDYPTNGWFTSFFNNPDCRIFIINMDISRNHVNFQIVLIAGKKRSYKKAEDDFREFKENISQYFDSNISVHVRKSMTFIPASNKRKKKGAVDICTR